MLNSMVVRKKNKLNNPRSSSEPVFIERPVPTEQQVKIFEKAVQREAREEEIDDNLSEIYRDKNGDLVDVSQLHYKKDSLFISVIKKIFVLAVLLSLGYGLYFYFSSQISNNISVDLTMSTPETVKAGEDFSYTISYRNNSKLDLNSLRLELKYPENFVVKSVEGTGLEEASASVAKNYYSLPTLAAGTEVNLIVSGKLIAKKDSANLFAASLSYAPGSFSTEFKKDAATSVMVKDLGFDLNFEYANSALVTEESQVDLIFSNVKDNFFDNFEVSFYFPENIILTNPVKPTSTTATSSASTLMVNKASSLVWQVSGLASSSETYHLPVHYRVNKKVADNQEIIIRLSKKNDNGRSYVFAEKTIQLNIMNSNLNLNLILNGSQNDGVASFGDTLNYSLIYSNKSDVKLSDVVIMAALKSDFLDWTNITDKAQGVLGDSTIIWTKEQIPSLVSLDPGEEGQIDFTIPVRAYNDSDLGKSFAITSYAQFNINNRQGGLNDSKSNSIITKINSDLKLSEKILYFDANNIPVGSGPLPPKVGQKTAVKVYWQINNNLHELNDTRVVTKLPDYVSFDGKNKATVGDLSFDDNTHSVIWNIGNLPVSTYQAQAEFNISVTPDDSWYNKIMVLLSDSKASAVDSDTKSILEKMSTPKTTKLEDDSIANLSNSGLVE